MNDNINHPDHYKSGRYECIEVMADILTPEQLKGFCIGNAFKYLWRAGKKAISQRIFIKLYGISTTLQVCKVKKEVANEDN